MTADGALDPRRAKHLRLGWWMLFVFLTMGLALEIMHGLKTRLYLDVSSESRRLLWTLPHAHGTLLGLVNIAFASSLTAVEGPEPSWRRSASRLLLWGSLLLPTGFFLGGLVVHGSDPWIGVLLSPVGAVLLIAGVWIVARHVVPKRR